LPRATDKGSEIHKAAVIGDLFKDADGLSLHVLIKLPEMITLAPFLFRA